MSALDLCSAIAAWSEESGVITRTFLSRPMRGVHELLSSQMRRLGMTVSIDGAGNLRGLYPGASGEWPRLLIGSHIDTVPGAGAYDGVLGVALGLALLGRLHPRQLPYCIEIAAFSEEEGVRFGVPFIGSRALAGSLDRALLERRDANGISVAQAIRDFGLDPAAIPEAALPATGMLGYLEFHIEQGPVLDALNLPLAVVDAIAGQSRLSARFVGRSNHAGTTPMDLRRDALAGAAEWIAAVERDAGATPGLVATVGAIEARPGAGNVIAGEVNCSLDVRHRDDHARRNAVARLIAAAHDLAERRGLAAGFETRLDQSAVACDAGLAALLARSVAEAGYPVHHMTSGAGHDAMILAAKVPVAMLFLRSPAGISHHPDERVNPEDVAAALEAGMRFLEGLEWLHA